LAFDLNIRSIFSRVLFSITLAATTSQLNPLFAQHIVLWVDEYDCGVDLLHGHTGRLATRGA